MTDDFWSLSDGSSALDDIQTSFDAGGGGFTVIPEGSKVLASVDDAEWRTQEKDGVKAEYLSLKWKISAPESVANRVIWHKLWLTDFDPNAKTSDAAKTKRDKARKMFITIDANAGGKLARKPGVPLADDVLFALNGKEMVLRLGVWNMNGNSGNWVQSVLPKGEELVVKEGKPSSGSASPMAQRSLDDDEIPF